MIRTLSVFHNKNLHKIDRKNQAKKTCIVLTEGEIRQLRFVRSLSLVWLRSCVLLKGESRTEINNHSLLNSLQVRLGWAGQKSGAYFFLPSPILDCVPLIPLKKILASWLLWSLYLTDFGQLSAFWVNLAGRFYKRQNDQKGNIFTYTRVLDLVVQ